MLAMGGCRQFYERDKRISEYIKAALDRNTRIIHHRGQAAKSVPGVIIDTSFSLDPNLKILLDSRIKVIVTSTYGLPIPDCKPGSLSEEDWKLISNVYSKHSEWANLAGKPDLTVFIGARFEDCISNAIHYYCNHFRQPNERVAYIPDACVSRDLERQKNQEIRLRRIGVTPIDYTTALNGSSTPA